jgi:dethiobiotin synthetase
MSAEPLGFFVTGTDTGVGKTLVACALLHAIAASGRSAVGMKPVAAGREDGCFHDVSALIASSSVGAVESLVNPYAFDPPIAPHIAAGLAGVRIDLDAIASAYARLQALAEVVVVEGAGGYMIPLNERETSADLARLLGLPVVLVVGMRLGCLNHALLTRQAIAASGLVCAGWVANCVEADMPRLDENVAALAQRLDSPMLGRVPFNRNLTARDVAPLLDTGPLLGAPGIA